MLWNNPFTNYNQHGIFIFFLEILLNHFPLPPPSFSQKSSPFAHCCPQLVVEWRFPCAIDSAVFTPAYNYIWEKQMLASNYKTEKLFWKAFSFPTCLPNVLAKQHQISLHHYLDLDLQEILPACFSLSGDISKVLSAPVLLTALPLQWVANHFDGLAFYQQYEHHNSTPPS